MIMKFVTISASYKRQDAHGSLDDNGAPSEQSFKAFFQLLSQGQTRPFRNEARQREHTAKNLSRPTTLPAFPLRPASFASVALQTCARRVTAESSQAGRPWTIFKRLKSRKYLFISNIKAIFSFKCDKTH